MGSEKHIRNVFIWRKAVSFVYVNWNGLRANRYEYGMEMYLFVHKDLKSSLTRDFDFWEKQSHEKKKIEAKNLVSDSL